MPDALQGWGMREVGGGGKELHWRLLWTLKEKNWFHYFCDFYCVTEQS
jgi:hypothetical protein